jgi:small subunit ribosomal protein S1
MQRPDFFVRGEVMAESGEDLEALLAEEGPLEIPRRGHLLEGSVLTVDSGGLIVDLGLKRDGVVPRSDLEKLIADGWQVNPGDEISVMVIDPEDGNGNLIVSVAQAKESSDWIEARRRMEADEIFQARPMDFNQGGLLIPFGRLSGFMPASHVSAMPRGLNAQERPEWLKGMVGKEIPMKVIEVDPQRSRLIFSERKAIRQWRREQKAEVIDKLEQGQVLKGVVTSLREFGAFVDVGGADGLVHISEMAWTRVENPSDVVRIGDEIETLVIHLDKRSHRIGLSIKQLQPNPWSDAVDSIEIGQQLDGEVTVLSSTGAFIRVAENLEGLLKLQEMDNLPNPGDQVQVKVIDFDPEHERLDLELVQ